MKKNLLKFEAQNKTIEETIFGPKYLKIPDYQRAYSWNKDKAEEFWNDLLENDNGYFIGLFIVQESEKIERRDIIDGQQRTLTITILLAAIREYLKVINENNKALELHREYISKKKVTDTVSIHRIEVGESTKIFFEEYVQNCDMNIDELKNRKNNRRSEEYKIQQNLILYFDLLSELGEKSKNKLQTILEVVQKILDLTVVFMKVENEEGAFVIFETVNARGEDLSAFDLVKNSIFSKLSQLNKFEEAKEKRSEMEEYTKKAEIDPTQFIKYYWSSKHGLTTSKNVFSKIKRKTEDYIELLEELNETAKIFAMIKKIENYNEEWEEIISDKRERTKIQNAIKGLKAINVRQFYIIIISILRNANKCPDPTRVFEAIEAFSFLFFTSGGRGNVIEGICGKYGAEIEKSAQEKDRKNRMGNINRIYDKLISELKTQLPEYEVFKEGFSDINYNRDWSLCKYIFTKLNKNIDKGKAGENRPVMSLEHILPKNPKKWGLSKKETKDYVNRIGNLIPIGGISNSELSDNKFEEKLGGIQQQKQIPMIKDFLDFLQNKNIEKRDEKSIQERQEHLAFLCYQTRKKFMK